MKSKHIRLDNVDATLNQDDESLFVNDEGTGELAFILYGDEITLTETYECINLRVSGNCLERLGFQSA